MALTVKSAILNAGKRLVDGALSGRTQWAPAFFKLGSAYNFTPSAAETDVTGATVWQGGPGLVSARSIAPGTVRYSMTVPEGVGPFSFGNVVVFGNASNGTILPLFKIVLPVEMRKEVSTTNPGATDPSARPGDRVVISITITQKVADANDPDLIVTIVAPSFASLPVFETDMTVPPPLSQPWQQFIISNDSRTGTPTLVTKRSSDNTYWGVPLSQNLRDPRFGMVVGGTAGEGYLPDSRSWLWGQRYTTPNNKFQGQIGGFGYNTIGPSKLLSGGSY